MTDREGTELTVLIQEVGTGEGGAPEVGNVLYRARATRTQSGALVLDCSPSPLKDPFVSGVADAGDGFDGPLLVVGPLSASVNDVLPAGCVLFSDAEGPEHRDLEVVGIRGIPDVGDDTMWLKPERPVPARLLGAGVRFESLFGWPDAEPLQGAETIASRRTEFEATSQGQAGSLLVFVGNSDTLREVWFLQGGSTPHIELPLTTVRHFVERD